MSLPFLISNMVWSRKKWKMDQIFWKLPSNAKIFQRCQKLRVESGNPRAFWWFWLFWEITITIFEALFSTMLVFISFWKFKEAIVKLTKTNWSYCVSECFKCILKLKRWMMSCIKSSYFTLLCPTLRASVWVLNAFWA